MQAIFAPLKTTLESRQFGFSDLLEVIAGFIPGSPKIAHALALHARDICDEDPEQTNLSVVVAEVYRRTFFDREHAEKYDTADMLDRGEEMMKSFADHLCGCFAMDDLQDSKGSMHPAAAGQ